MTDMVTLTIDGHEVTVPAGTTVLNAAASIGIEIPVVCYHPHLTANGLCRVCSVDVGRRLQAAACVTQVSPGMVVNTQTKDVRLARRTILEMLASAVDLSEAPHLQELLLEYDADPERFAAFEPRTHPSTTTTRSTSATTTSASTAGAVCRSAPKTRSTPSP
jgi:NADH dehydrogenase/NADH:ubiquinone oxidoreductase subunit G